jgi:diguanylate cyclase (GGDEF)-like protein/PAS domain S-box-containing protein
VNHVIDTAPCGYLSALADGTIVEVNQTFLAWTGFTREDLVRSKRFRDLLTAGGRIYHETHYKPLLHMQGHVREIALDLVRSDGEHLPVVISSVLDAEADSTSAAISTTVTYARERHLYERQLIRARDDARRARERAEQLQRLTARLARALDERHVAALVTEAVADVLEADEASVALRPVDRHREPVAHTHRRRDAGAPERPRVWLSTPLRDGSEAVGVVHVARTGKPAFDAADRDFVAACAEQCIGPLERIELFEAVARMAGTDELTGLPNRRAWTTQIAREFARARRTADPMSLAVLDLDHFKRFNDTHGHPAGDRLLERVAAAWATQLRPHDLLARYGGEEFVLLVSGCDLDEAVVLAERLRGAVPDGQTCSVGIAQWDGTEHPDQLFERADRALYDAKGAGRDRLQVAIDTAH